MHDPKVVVVDIVRPWPRLERRTLRPEAPRWEFRYRRATWKRPLSGWKRFWTVAGVRLYWPALITIWHEEPGGRDALTVCRTRVQKADGSWRYSKGWHWHVHHWSIQVHPLQALRRALLTRCAECGRKGSPNISHQWDGDRGRWWRGEPGLYHSQCSSLHHLRRVKDQDEAVIRALVAEIRVRSDEELEQTIERLTGHKNRSLDFHLRYRLKNVLKEAS